MFKYFVAAVSFGLVLIIFANLSETIQSSERIKKGFKDLSVQQNIIASLKHRDTAEISTKRRIESLDALNREIEIGFVFIDSNNERHKVNSILLVIGQIVLLLMTMKFCFRNQKRSG